MSDAATKYAPTLPKAVREQAERANETQRRASGHETPPTTVVEGAPNLARPADDLFPSTLAPHQPQPAQPDLDAKYRTLQGKYDAEVTATKAENNRLQGQISTLQSQIQSLQQILAAANSRPTPAPAPAAPAPDTNLDADRAEYGELVDKAGSWAERRMRAEMDALKSQIANLTGQTQQQAVLTQQQRVHAALDAWQARTGNDWARQNDDAKFIDWLKVTDPFAGRMRGTLLSEAYKAGDGNRVVTFFDTYAAEQAALHGQQPSQGQSTSQPPAAMHGKVPLETLASPGRGAPGNAPQAPAKRIWTGKDVEAFYNRRRRGEFRGREAEAAALERDIILAPAEGRYQQR